MRRPFRLPLALILFLAVGLPAQAAATAPDVLARLQRWRGAALADQPGIRAAGKVTVGGLEGHATREVRRSGLYHLSLQVGDRRFGEGADTAGAWRQNHSGQVDALPARPTARRRAAQRAWFDSYAEAQTALGAPERHADTDCDVVRIEHPWADPIELLIAADGRLVAERTKQSGHEQVIEFSDWREVDGARWPFREHLNAESQQRTFSWETIAVADGDVPARPAHQDIGRIGAASGEARPAASFELEIHNGYLFVQGTLQGRPTSFLIDTGASITVVDRTVAEELQLPLRGEFTSGGAGTKRREASWAGQVTIRLGSESDSHVELRPQVSSFSLQELARGLGHSVDAILGRELLLAFAVEIDYARQRLLLHDQAQFAAPAGAIKVGAAATSTGHVEVEVAVEDLPPAPFILDTGAPVALILNSTWIDATPALQGRKGLQVMLGGVGGGNAATQAPLAKVMFAGHTFTAVPGLFSRAKKGAMAMRDSAGILGTQVLRRFRCVFDLRNGALWLTPGEGIDAPFSGRRGR